MPIFRRQHFLLAAAKSALNSQMSCFADFLSSALDGLTAQLFWGVTSYKWARRCQCKRSYPPVPEPCVRPATPCQRMEADPLCPSDFLVAGTCNQHARRLATARLPCSVAMPVFPVRSATTLADRPSSLRACSAQASRAPQPAQFRRKCDNYFDNSDKDNHELGIFDDIALII